jgi:4-hydroxy-2-oxoheptanedioate aldolase
MTDVLRSSLRERLGAGETVTGSFVNLGSTITAEIMGLADFDWLVIDLEHGAGSEGMLVGHLQALSHTGVSTLVRVEAINAARILHALDSGADGVLVPQLRSVDDARRCVEFCRYGGGRGVARYNRSWQWGLRPGTLAEADGAVICAVQIETAEALAAVDEIAAVDGVDVVFVGPGDLSVSLGCEIGSEEHVRAIETVIAAGLNAGKLVGIFCLLPEHIERWAKQGVRLFILSGDLGLLGSTCAAATGEATDVLQRYAAEALNA